MGCNLLVLKGNFSLLKMKWNLSFFTLWTCNYICVNPLSYLSSCHGATIADNIGYSQSSISDKPFCEINLLMIEKKMCCSWHSINVRNNILNTPVAPVAPSNTCPLQGVVCLIKLIITLSSICLGHRISMNIHSPHWDSFFTLSPYVYHGTRVSKVRRGVTWYSQKSCSPIQYMTLSNMPMTRRSLSRGFMRVLKLLIRQ